MNYLFLKNIISTLISEFVCPNCNIGRPKEQNLDISKISRAWIELIFSCPHCKTKNILKTEFAPITLQTKEWKELFRKLIESWKIFTNKKKWIPKEEIKKIEEKLSQNLTVTELIKDD